MGKRCEGIEIVNDKTSDVEPLVNLELFKIYMTPSSSQSVEDERIRRGI